MESYHPPAAKAIRIICRIRLFFVGSGYFVTATHISFLNNQLLSREHGRCTFVLPATYWTMNTSGARRAFLCSRTTRVSLFDSNGRLRWRVVCPWRTNGALNHQWRLFATARATDQQPEEYQRHSGQCTLSPVRSSKPRGALVAKNSAGPGTPTQAHDFRAAFRAKVWSISREERQVCEALS